MLLFNNITPFLKKTGSGSISDIIKTKSETRQTQHRFVFYMERCIGCHSCEVACGEQNNLPADTAWRRVGEIEGGIFPDVKRYFISLSCNHCLDAPCLKGCPADAYFVNEKGIVIHNDPACIGCGYCTWNCPYGVPTFQKDRKIVTKCDMCTNRLDQGLQPACAEACPAGAIETEEVSIRQILDNYKTDANVPAMPSPEISVPSTRIVAPTNSSIENFTKANDNIVRPEMPHYSLIFMTVFTQLAAGGFFLSFLTDLMRTFMEIPKQVYLSVGFLSPVLFGIAGLSLASSTLHLGRPAYFYRAFKRWRTSWLSREAIGFAGFSATAFVYTAMLFYESLSGVFGFSGSGSNIYVNIFRLGTGFITISLGIYGVYASSRIYRVPSRPAWDSFRTTAEFFTASLLCGVALFSHAASVASVRYSSTEFLDTAIQYFSLIGILTGAAAALSDAAIKRQRIKSKVPELSKSALLLDTVFYRENTIRHIFLGTAMLFSFLTAAGYFTTGSLNFAVLTLAVLLLYTLYSLLGRYLFFVTVVPDNIPGNFIYEASRPLRGTHD